MAQDAVAPQVMRTLARMDCAPSRRRFAVSTTCLPTPPSLGRSSTRRRLVAYVVTTYAVGIAVAVLTALTVHCAFGPRDAGGWRRRDLPYVGLCDPAASTSPGRRRPSPPWTCRGSRARRRCGGGGRGVRWREHSQSEWLGVRTFFNMSNHFLAECCGLGCVRGDRRDARHPRHAAAKHATTADAGLAAGFAHFAVNSGFVAIVVHLSDPSVTISRALRPRFRVMPYSIGYGLAAFAFVVMQDNVALDRIRGVDGAGRRAPRLPDHLCEQIARDRHGADRLRQGTRTAAHQGDGGIGEGAHEDRRRSARRSRAEPRRSGTRTLR